MKTVISVVFGLATVCAAAQAQPDRSETFNDKFLQLGAGPEGGSLKPVGETLCEAINSERKTTLVRCVVVRSAGSMFNIHAVANGSLQMGLAQEEVVRQAYDSKAIRGAGDLRTVAILHSVPISVMARKDAGISDLSKIGRHVVNVDIRGSGIHFVATAVLQALNLRESDLAGLTHLPPESFDEAFCDGKVDVIFSSLAHPSEQHRKLRACGGEFLDIPPELMSKLSKASVQLRPMVIPAGLYGPNQREVKTAGTRYLLITNRRVDDEAISRVSTLLARQSKAIQASQPILSSLVPMTQDDIDQLVVPMHTGAMRSFVQRAQ